MGKEKKSRPQISQITLMKKENRKGARSHGKTRIHTEQNEDEDVGDRELRQLRKAREEKSLPQKVTEKLKEVETS